MTDGEGREIPPKGEMSPQVGRQLDTKNVDFGKMIDPRELRVDPARLFLETTQQSRMAICISDAQQPDSPIVYANQAFLELTGYAREEILGRNCRFLQGSGTDPEQIQKLRDGIAAERYTVVDLLNYKKDGTPFWNAVHVGPVYDEAGTLQYFYGSQWNITDIVAERRKAETQRQIAQELRHRTDNIFAVLGAIINLTARRETDVQEFTDKIGDRIQALAAAHRTTIVDEIDQQSVLIADLVAAVMKPYRNRFAGRVSIEGPAIDLEPGSVTALGLTLHELATNAIKYGSLRVDTGEVSIFWTMDESEFTLVWKEHGGQALAPASAENSKGTGTIMINGMVANLGGTIERTFTPSGFQATIALPLHNAN